MDCPFCNIDTEKGRILKEGVAVRVILSNPRLMPGHVLVLPKKHVEKISDLERDAQLELLDTVMEFQEKILKQIAGGCDIRQNYRPFQKQDRLKVNHLHIHLQPRELFDELYKKCQIFEKEVFKDLPDGEMKIMTEKLGENT